MNGTPDERGKAILLGLNDTGKHIYAGSVDPAEIARRRNRNKRARRQRRRNRRRS